MKDQAGLRRICIICFIAMLIMLVVHVQILVTFNRRSVSVHGNDSGNSAYMEIDPRSNSTSRWEKRDYPLTEDETVTLIGQTIDATLYNNSGNMVQEWGLRLNITGDCFINQAWNGTMEIHQYAGTGRERVQTLNLQDYALDDVILDYKYDGDLLIPLQKGDYVLYHPESSEMTLRAGEKLKIGVIFYFLNDLDLSDYDLSLRFHRLFSQGWSFFVFICAAALWILSTVIYATGVYIYRNEQKQMKLRRTGLSYMSTLYEAIYIINLPTGEITPVSPGDYIEELRGKFSHAKELLDAAIRGDSADEYLDAALAFADLGTLPDRLKDRDSLIFEFVSALHGWCRFSFFAMEREEGKPLENVIFAVQDINDEKSEIKDLADRVNKAEAVSTANNAFLSAASEGLRAPVGEILALDGQLLRETDPAKIRQCAEGIRGTAERMLLLISGLEDRAAAEAQSDKRAVSYSLRPLIDEVLAAVRPAADSRGICLETEVAGAVPDVLSGDAARLKEAAASLLAGAVNRAQSGSVRLSVFGKQLDGPVIHLLFSVRSLPEGEDSGSVPKAVAAEPDLDREVAGSLLSGAGSALKTVRSSDGWADMYFEIDQRIAEGTEA